MEGLLLLGAVNYILVLLIIGTLIAYYHSHR